MSKILKEQNENSGTKTERWGMGLKVVKNGSTGRREPHHCVPFGAAEASVPSLEHWALSRVGQSYGGNIVPDRACPGECLMLDQGVCIYSAGNGEPLKSVRQKEWCVNVLYKSLNPLYSRLVLHCYGLLSKHHPCNPHHTLGKLGLSLYHKERDRSLEGVSVSPQIP